MLVFFGKLCYNRKMTVSMAYYAVYIGFTEVIEGGSNTMSLQIEKLEKNMAKLTIEASAEDFEAAIKAIYDIFVVTQI